MSQLLRARRLLTGQGWLDDHQLRMDRGVITAIEPIPAGINTREADLLCPAYIDIHVHGGAGADFMDGTPAAVRVALRCHAGHGTTTLFPTTTTGTGANPPPARGLPRGARHVDARGWFPHRRGSSLWSLFRRG